VVTARYRVSPAFFWSRWRSLPPDESSVTECLAALEERSRSRAGLLVLYPRATLCAFGGWAGSLGKPGKWWASSFHVQSLNLIANFRISLNIQILPIFCCSRCGSNEAIFALRMSGRRLTLWVYSGSYNWICFHVWIKQPKQTSFIWVYHRWPSK